MILKSTFKNRINTGVSTLVKINMLLYLWRDKEMKSEQKQNLIYNITF